MERSDLIECIRTRTFVKYEGSEYLPLAYKLSRTDKSWIHSVELQDMRTNKCLVIAPLDKVVLDN
ncbi:hypothetical protein [Scatolibacter rhodanostii]|uniref:hypothetical protein n=1 Tax=Scatolibacter rhodanostii TaxID=2014781 RepID=UPI000C077223|nr:hypothetical protein [Scatolibacter rhodanostii]